MEHRYLGRTGIRVSPLCIGCMTFGGTTDAQQTQRIVDRALDQGINFFDTANVYNYGKSEEVTGQALKQSGKRDRVVLATKVHGNMHKGDPLNPNRWGNSRRGIIEQAEASLRRLQTDWIDLYQIHRPHPQCPIDETLRALDDLVRAGKVRYIGCSTFAAWQVVEALWTSDKLGLNRFVTEQPAYNLLDRRIERELIPMAQTYSMGLMPWSPLAGGFLTGKYHRDGTCPQGARHGKTGQLPDEHRFKQAKVFDVIEGLEQLAKLKECTVGQLALAWCMGQPGITSPIIGPRTLEQLEDNLGSLNVTINDEDRQTIDKLVPPGSVVVPFYEANFGPHPHRV